MSAFSAVRNKTDLPANEERCHLEQARPNTSITDHVARQSNQAPYHPETFASGTY